MKLDKLTRKMTESLSDSASLCESRGNAEQTEDHLLYSIMTQKEGMMNIILSRLKMNPQVFISHMKKVCEVSQKFPEVVQKGILPEI